MTDQIFLSRVTLRRDASVGALLPLLLGETRKQSNSVQSGHHLVWSLFADKQDRKRDFLWRETTAGTFLILSARLPKDCHGLFHIDEPKPFTPQLAAGDRLQFSLRANPVIRKRKSPDAVRSTKHDVVMAALNDLPEGERAAARFPAIRDSGFSWLARQADKAGFAVDRDEVTVDGYTRHRIPRRQKGQPLAFSTVDFDGVIEVRDPAKLLAKMACGFGAAKAYGCGLMLIRRA